MPWRAGKVLAPAKDMGEMSRIIFNNYLNAALAAAFVVVVVTIAVYGVICIRRALGNPAVTTVEVGSLAPAE